MDRNQIIGIILITVVMLAWMFYMAPTDEQLERQQRERELRDSLNAVERIDRPAIERDMAELRELDQPLTALGVFGNTAVTDTITTVVETPFQRFLFTNLGGGPAQIELVNHIRYDGEQVTLLADTTRSAYNLGFLSTENYNIDTQDLLFIPRTTASEISIGHGETTTIVYDLILEDGRTLTFEYLISGDGYELGLSILFDGVRDLISGSYFEFGWQPRLRTTERQRNQETQYSAAFVYAGGALDDINLTSAGTERRSITGNIGWVATKTKFFTQIIQPVGETDGAILMADVTGRDNDIRTHYRSIMRSIVPAAGESQFRLFVGPLDHRHLNEFHTAAYDMVDTGFRFLRWFSDPFVNWIVLPFFGFFGNLLGNYGLVIILFAFVIKIVLYPLTKKSFESMAAMRELQPEMKALQEKYKDNPQAQQQATMKLFKKAKVNPLGGCLPNLLQAPVLITLWRYFQNSIEIRQESFLWASDLSAPDVIIQLPFTIPILGDFIAGFVLLMSATMVLQMKISGQGAAANPQMKIFTYILPVVLFLFFNQFASGLSLYYLVYNLLSIGQQMMINKQIDHVKMMETVDKKKARQMAKEQKMEERKKIKDTRNKGE
ncbi:MAG: YidC/Oxa1 family insertase periplasmic-domain containing protein [Balneolales bacterium]|nr:YidC/Oxa1 family insertase periplasmic-domain containing protein [Balneolales bacterium]